MIVCGNLLNNEIIFSGSPNILDDNEIFIAVDGNI